MIPGEGGHTYTMYWWPLASQRLLLALLVGLSWGGAEKRGNLTSNLGDMGGEGYSTISSKFYSNSR